MQQELFGPNVGIFVLGRVIFKVDPTAQLHFRKDKPSIETASKAISGAMYWETGIQYCAHETKFGRVGVCYDHQNTFAQETLTSIKSSEIEYRPTDKRAESELQVSYFPTQVLYHMALEGHGGSVEFRRLARKFIREAKNANCDVMYFPEAIFGEESTQKVLQQIAGTQVRVVTLADVFGEELGKRKKRGKESEKREITISPEFTEFEKQRAAEILRTKLKQ